MVEIILRIGSFLLNVVGNTSFNAKMDLAEF